MKDTIFALGMGIAIVIALIVGWQSAKFAKELLAQDINLTDPIVADPRSTTTMTLIHVQIDLRNNECKMTYEGSSSVKQQYTFANTAAVLDDQGMEVTPAGTEGTDMVAIALTNALIRSITQECIDTGKMAGTIRSR